MANPTFSEAFDIVSAKVSNYMLIEYNAGRLTDTNYATVQAEAISSIINGAITLHLQTEDYAAQTSIKQYQLSTLLPDEHAKNTEQIALMTKQKLHQEEETKYTNARKRIALASRIDNLMIEDLKAQLQQLATVGAGGLVPSTTDFTAANSLRQSVYDRAIAGVALNNSIATGETAEGTIGSVTFTAGTTYTKAT